MPKLAFLPFEKKHAAAFKSLNVEWLEAFFEVEPYDEQVLSHPEKYILSPGGAIYMACLEGEIIGTFAYIKKGEALYEFSKMAIAPKYRGKGYGNIMVQFVIEEAKRKGWKKLILYSSTVLENSIHLYRKYGFIEVPLVDCTYSRGNIKMEKVLSS